MRALLGAFHPDGRVEPLRHSSPDPNSSWQSSDGRCWLAPQPITSHCGRFSLVFNGTIYNHHQVRLGLRFQGWRGTSDGETLVEGLAQRGPALLLDLRGMFAFAAYDAHKEQLLLARDRLGIKPLYLSWQSHGLQFASQRRALPGGNRLDAQLVGEVLAFGHGCTPANFPGPHSQGVVSLPAGMVVRINHSRRHDPVRYWPPQPRPDWSPLPIRDRRWARTFLRQQLEEVVRQHLIADVPLACLLSGGLSSGVLAGLASRLQPGGIATFTVALAGSSTDATNHARQMARHCGSCHTELMIQEDEALAWVEQGLSALDVPTAESINTYLITRAAANQGIKVALSGLGAYEFLGRSPSHRLIPWLQLLRWIPAQMRQGLLQAVSPGLDRKLKNLPRWDHWHLALALRRCFSDQDLKDAGANRLEWPEPPPQRISQAWGQARWAELFGTTEPMLLRDADAMGMACGLELRVPYLDHQLVEIALRMPQRYQCAGKGLLRQACGELLPPGHLKQPNLGLGLPMAAWMNGPLREMCLFHLSCLQQSGLLHPAWIRQQWQSFEANQLHWKRAWILVSLGAFSLHETNFKT